MGIGRKVEADTVRPRSLQRGELPLRFLHHEVTADRAQARTVEADTVRPRSLQRGELPLPFLHHEVTADRALAMVDQRRDRYLRR